MNFTLMRIVVRKKLISTNSWVVANDGIIINDAIDIQYTNALGKKKDTFGFTLSNNDGRFYSTKHSGDGVTTDFNFQFGPIPDEHISGAFKKLFVYVDDIERHDYNTLNNGSTISFDTAPASGADNIVIKYPVVEEDDLIRIYRIKNSTLFADSHILDEGTVTSISGSISSDTKNLTVDGESFLTQAFKGLAFARPSGVLNRAHLYIQDVIAQVNEFNQDRPIYGQDATEWGNIGNDTPTLAVQYTMSFRTAIEIIDDLSTNDYTGDGQYIYYMLYNSTDERYEFNWKAKSAVPIGTLTEGTDYIISVKPNKNSDDVVNSAIYNCGNDCDGNSMEFHFFDFSSGGASKWKYVTKTNTIAEALINNEFVNNRANWAKQTLDETEVRTINYPTSYAAYTMQFLDRDATGAVDGNPITPANDRDFNNAIWKEARWQGWGVAKAIVDVLKDPKNSLTLVMDYPNDSNTYVVGDVYYCNFPSSGMEGKLLRIQEIEYELNTTTLNLAEDEVTIDS